MSVTTNAIGMFNFIPGNTISSLGPWIASKDADWTNYTTVQDAINAANAAGPSASENHTVYVKAGTYTENLTLYPFVNIVGAQGDFTTNVSNPVIISGIHTLASGTNTVCYFDNITFTSSGTSSTFSITGAATDTNLVFNNCKIVNSNSANNIFTASFSSANLNVNFFDCYISAAGKYFNHTGSGTAFTTNIVQSTMTISTAQVETGTALPYTINATDSTVSMDINNNLTEAITLTFTGSSFSSTFSNPGGIVAGTFTRCSLPSLSFSGTYSSLQTFAFIDCSLQTTSATSPVSFPVGAGIKLINCCDLYNIQANVDKMYPAFTKSEKYLSQYNTTTSDATPTVVYSIPIPASMSAWVKVSVIGTNSAHTDTTGAIISAIVQCTGAAMNVVNQDRLMGATSSGDVTLVTNFGSGTLDVTVTGIAATTYYWVCTVEWQKVSTGS